MAGTDKLQRSVELEQSKEHGCVAAHGGAIAQKPVQVIEDFHRVDPEGQSRESTLQHGCEQRGSQPLAGHVRNQDRETAVRQGTYVKVITANLVTRPVHPGDGEMGIILQPMRNKGLLDLAGNIQFLLETLAFSFVLNQARSLQNASGLCA